MSTAPIELTNQLTMPGTLAGNPSYTLAERMQKEHFDRVAELYEAHYSDPCSLQYRRRFIYQPMFEGLNLAGKKVLDAMCGSGQTSEYLLSRGALMTGLDISPEIIE